MKDSKVKKCFYNFKNKVLFVKDLDFDMQDKDAWKSIEEKPARKEECYFLGEMNREDFGSFDFYVREKLRIGVRDEPLPALSILLKYFEEWKTFFYRS